MKFWSNFFFFPKNDKSNKFVDKSKSFTNNIKSKQVYVQKKVVSNQDSILKEI